MDVFIVINVYTDEIKGVYTTCKKAQEWINQMAEKLKESLSDLEKDVERRKILVRNLSHELKTPIGVIKGYAEGLKYGVITGEEKQQQLSENTSLCNSICFCLLDFLLRTHLFISSLTGTLSLYLLTSQQPRLLLPLQLTLQDLQFPGFQKE